MSAPQRSSASPSFWLASALIVMPALQLMPIDFDRSGVLVLLLPFLWSGRELIAPGFNRLGLHSRWLSRCAWFFLISTGVAVGFSAQFAPAFVTSACWLLLGVAGLIASETIRREPGTSGRLLGAIALSVTSGTVAVWLLWAWGGRGAVPLYAHHRIFGLHTLSGAIAATGLVMRFWPQRTRRNIWLAVGAINWAGLLWSGGRGPALALVAGLFAWWLTGDAPSRQRLFRASACLLVAGLIVSLSMWSPRPELGWWNYVHRTTSANVGPALSLSAVTATRSDFWRESLQRVQDKPWIGHGPDAYRFLTPKLDGQQPHNFIIQLLLDVGVAGALAAIIFIGTAFAVSWQHLRKRGGNSDVAPWFALALASTVAGLLDGVYYHLLAFLPAAIALNAMLAFHPGREDESAAQTRGRSLFLTITGVAAMVLMVHTLIFYMLAVAPPPENPLKWQAQLVRKFPSTTFGLWRWFDAWQSTEPDTTLHWCRWAQGHSANSPSFHIYAAHLLIDRGDRAGAVEELHGAYNKAHWTNQPAIAEMLRGLEAPAR